MSRNRIPSSFAAVRRGGKILLFALWLIACAAPVLGASRRGDGPDLDARVAVTLERHLAGTEIERWLGTLPDPSPERSAALWILAWLPPSDLVALTPDLLREHVDLAVAARAEAPWRDQLGDDLWLRFIVPHRVSQEPAQPWRSVIRRELWPRVRDAASMELAALEVNRWCREQATFKSTSGRDAGPLTTMARGIGRCEEEMILTICALRAVGLPARSCATPYWTFTNNNHAWVEVWADGRWHYLGGCEPDRCLDRAWFTGAARRAGFVRSVGYGEFTPGDEPLYRADDGCTIINSTPVYADPITLTARLGGRYADCEARDIYVNVLNFGSLRPLARIASGDMIELGPGEYAITGGPEGELLLEVAGGRSGASLEVVLDEADLYDLAASPGFWLRYPEGDEAPSRDLDLVSEASKRLSDLRIRARADDREKLRTPNEREREILEKLDADTRARVEEILAQPLRRASLVFLLLEHYAEPETREALLAFLEHTDDKDLLEHDEWSIRNHIDNALAVRERLAPLGLSLPDSVFVPHLLSGRIDREPAAGWRGGLPLIELADTPEASLSAVLAAHHARTRKIEPGFFGAPLDPLQSWRLGEGTERDLGVGLVGLLRRNGFPARYRYGRTEVWLGAWRRLDPLTGEPHAGEESDGSGAPGRLAITITRGGLAWSGAESYRHFNLCRPEAGHLSSPWWDPALGEQEWDAGAYVLCSTMRVPGGSVYGRLRAFEVAAGELTEVALPLDIDVDDWDPTASLIGEPGVDRMEALFAGGALPVRDEGLLFLFEPGEPAARMITALGRVAERLRRAGVAIEPVLIDGDTAEWNDKLAEAGLPAATAVADAEAFAELRREGEPLQPLTRLAVAGETLLLRQGFDTAIDNSVHLALDVFEAR